MSQYSDLQDENVRLRAQLERLQAQVLESCHQLRCSVTSAAGYAKLVAKRGASLEPETHAEAVAQIQKHIEVSTQLIGELLTRSVQDET